MPADLELFLALLVGIVTRDRIGTRAALRAVAVTYDDAAGYRLIQALNNSLQPNERFWFRNLLGPRIEPEAPELEPDPPAPQPAPVLALALAGNTEPEPVCP